jgi:hypothetical protein
MLIRYSQLLVGVSLSECLTFTTGPEQMTKYNEDTGRPYQKKVEVERVYLFGQLLTSYQLAKIPNPAGHVQAAIDKKIQESNLFPGNRYLGLHRPTWTKNPELAYLPSLRQDSILGKEIGNRYGVLDKTYWDALPRNVGEEIDLVTSWLQQIWGREVLGGEFSEKKYQVRPYLLYIPI